MVKHFFESFTTNLGCALHISATGENTHHMIEAIFKCVAKALGQAVAINGSNLPSTKGVL
jgi:imidazoleglycerol-phosphate dehydratase/histidinol-phosphatase